MSVAVVQPTKWCPGCERTKPWGDFHAATRWTDGTMRTPRARCKLCQLDKEREWRKRKKQQDPQWWKRRKAHQWEWLRSNPERWAAHLARLRERRTGRVSCGLNTVDDSSVLLDPTPFAAWLRTLGAGQLEIALATGLDPSQVHRYLTGKRRVSLDTVDRALLRAGTLTTLDDLYPMEDTA